MSRPTVAIIGLGLIGGSLARDLRARGLRVFGHDADEDTLNDTLESGVGIEPLGGDFENLAHTDWLVIAVPVDAATATLKSVQAHARHVQLITDVGSTKRGVLSAAASLGLGPRFVGSHPLAGDHRSGWRASRTGLFAEQRVYLCAAGAVDDGALRAARALWRLCGARTELIDAAEHDRLLAWTSHLPQALSSALAGSLETAGIPIAALGPGGRDMTRLAASSPPMWTGIALENADELNDGLAAVEKAIAELRALLAARDRCALHAFFARGRHWSTLGEGDASPQQVSA